MKKSLFKLALYLVCYLLFAASCKQVFPEEEPDPSYRQDFEIFWNDVNTTYPFFEYDGVDWEATYNAYSPLVDTAGEAGLFDIMTKMLTPLLDRHLSLQTPDGLNWSSSEVQTYFSGFSLRNILLNYRQDTTHYKARSFFAFQPEPGILYCYLRTFTQEGISGRVDSAIRHFGARNLRGVIVDVRNNGGGLVLESEQVAGLFTDKKVAFGYEKFKNGPRRNDFTEPELREFSPYRSLNYTGKVRLLTNRYSASSSERLRLCLKRLPQARCYGDTTYGATSPIIERQLPNMWQYVMVGSVNTDLEGKLYERIGIPPDSTIQNQLRDLQSGTDKVLNAAIRDLR